MAFSAAGLLSSQKLLWAVGEDADGKPFSVTAFPYGTLEQLAGKKIKDILEFHKKELKEEYIPFFENKRIDWQHGGYLHEFNEDGTHVPYKEMYYQGRGLWVHGYLVNNFSVSDKFKKSLIKSRDLLVQNGLDENGYWVSKISADDGKPLEPSTNIYGDIYMILGLTQTYLATKDERDIDLAIQTAYKVTERIVNPAYQHLAGHGAANIPGTKRLGTWVHFLSAITPLLKVRKDEGVDRIAQMCAHNILNYHWQPGLRVYLEYLDHQFKPFPPNPVLNNRFISAWHSVQAAFVVMDEALRLGHAPMFRDAMETGISTLEICWLDKRGLVSLDNPEMKPSSEGSLVEWWGMLDDILVFCLLALEHNHETLAIKYYDKAFELGYSHPEKWRKPSPYPGGQRGMFHHPRRLFYSIEILERIVAHDGKPSNFLETAAR
ncbi:MAG: hypothetical protein A2W90_16870 [Bacteroidetes bacterium GWF2_42_66]|nr:MAG: hypothetical protein A2W92_03745 [Bacteroidetes bacterium GWA2_42_15]OFX96362.1 MAG: hypothetical protein A2W89_05800 [Bacteroidetes bacterium GWE2_42_39]OFY46401.1 MAG: hypothetical protein A2W90_16870 [Bacteroidetes bacterium GWF2_42_66]